MEFELPDELRTLLEDATYAGGYSDAVVKGFRKVIQIIDAAPDERLFYTLKGLRYEKLSGKRSHQRSMRINNQWRLIVEIEKGTPNNIVIVKGIEDYHGKRT